MVGRLQRWLVFGWLVLAGVWIAAGRHWSPGVVLTGLAVLLFTHALVLGLECIAARRVGRGDPSPSAPLPAWLRAWCVESLLAPRVFCGYQPFLADAIPDHLPAGGRRGVVLVHGFLCNRAFWTPWLRTLRADGRAFVAVNLEPIFAPLDHHAPTIEAAVRQVTAATGLPPLLVCHSMGGLAARAWLRTADPGRVHRVVTIGTPHGGTWMAGFSHTANGRQMRIGNPWLRALAEHEATQPGVPFTCWYSNCDNIVFPPSVATLPDADNRFVSGKAHVAMAFDHGIRRETLALLDAP